jgi:two-component system sensor histidine kinase BaeS
MSQTLRTRLFLNGLIILLIGMGLAGVLFWQAAARLYIETQTENLLAQARLSAAAMQGQPFPGGTSEPYSQTTNTLPGIHTRILSPEGSVLISLPLMAGNFVQLPVEENSAPVSPEELSRRPEIASAMQGKEASAVRAVGQEKRRVLYVAAPVYAENGTVQGLIYLAVPLPPGGLPSSFLLQLLGAGGLAVLLALVAGTLLSRRITAPVSAIIQGAKAVSDGDLNLQISTESEIRELDALGQTFNQMVTSLRQSDQARDAFVADVAHELRTPLTVIKGTIETLEDGAMDDREGRGPLLSAMQQETDRLIRLVSDLLVLTRAHSGMLKLDLKPVELGVLAQERCDLLMPLAARKQIRFSLHNENQFWVLGDQDRLAQVLDNLLANALRYSPEGGTVEVISTEHEGLCTCSVQDHGTGIAAEHLPFLFERFYRVDASRNRQSGGAGLGLAIVRALLEAQGGTIEVESQVGLGTTFRFTLPKRENCHKTD